MKNADKPAYPTPIAGATDGGIYPSSDFNQHIGGLTKREYFAAMAMQAVIQKHGVPRTPDFEFAFADSCVTVADQMLKALES